MDNLYKLFFDRKYFFLPWIIIESILLIRINFSQDTQKNNS